MSRPPLSGSDLAKHGINPRNLEWFASHELLKRLHTLGATTVEATHTIYHLGARGKAVKPSLLEAVETVMALSDDELKRGLEAAREWNAGLPKKS